MAPWSLNKLFKYTNYITLYDIDIIPHGFIPFQGFGQVSEEEMRTNPLFGCMLETYSACCL